MRTRVYRGFMLEYRQTPTESGWYILNGPTYDPVGMELPKPPYQDWYVETIIDRILDTDETRDTVTPNNAIPTESEMHPMFANIPILRFIMLIAILAIPYLVIFTPLPKEEGTKYIIYLLEFIFVLAVVLPFVWDIIAGILNCFKNLFVRK